MLLGYIDQLVCGCNVIIVGVSNYVGWLMGLELLIVGCIVISCYKFIFKDVLEQVVCNVDILVVVVGCLGIVLGEWVKLGVVVIDVGINWLDDGWLVGDVGFEVVVQWVSWIILVLGGVGLMIVVMLMQNILEVVEVLS